MIKGRSIRWIDFQYFYARSVIAAKSLTRMGLYFWLAFTCLINSNRILLRALFLILRTVLNILVWFRIMIGFRLWGQALSGLRYVAQVLPLPASLTGMHPL